MLLSRHRLLLAATASTALLLSACGAESADLATTTADDTTADVVPEITTEQSDPVQPEVPVVPILSEDLSPEERAVLASTATRPDGTTFAISDFAGQTVFVETFATWCSTCRKQLKSTTEAATQAGDGAVFLALSVETDLDPAELATYAAENGFVDITFAVMDAEALAAFNEQFGRSVLNAPSTPKFIVRPDGAITELVTGLESADEILAQLA